MQFDELIRDPNLRDDLHDVALDIARNPYIFSLIPPWHNIYGVTIERISPPPLTIYFRIDEDIEQVELLEILRA